MRRDAGAAFIFALILAEFGLRGLPTPGSLRIWVYRVIGMSRDVSGYMKILRYVIDGH